jgi:methylmalonyl-CoA/ethylmalonyl-CoA epimerase
LEKREIKESYLSQLHHVMIVVEDVNKAAKFYESLGIGPFISCPAMTGFVKLDLKDESGFLNSKAMIAQIGPVELQLFQPGGEETSQGKFLKRKGEGIHHLGFIVDDIEEAERELKKLGLEVNERARRADGTGFTEFRTDTSGGVTIQIRQGT